MRAHQVGDDQCSPGDEPGNASISCPRGPRRRTHPGERVKAVPTGLSVHARPVTAAGAHLSLPPPGGGRRMDTGAGPGPGPPGEAPPRATPRPKPSVAAPGPRPTHVNILTRLFQGMHVHGSRLSRRAGLQPLPGQALPQKRWPARWRLKSSTHPPCPPRGVAPKSTCACRLQVRVSCVRRQRRAPPDA